MVEGAGRAAEGGIFGDAARERLVGDAEIEALRFFIERSFAQKLAQNLAVEPEDLRLRRRDRAAQSPAQLLQPLAEDTAEAFG